MSRGQEKKAAHGIDYRHPNDSKVELTELVLPRHTHPFGSEADTCSGGQIMCWMDTAAGIAAKRHCRQHVVTVSFDDIHFRASARLGEIVSVNARVNKAFNTSMEVGIVVYGEHPLKGTRRLLCSGYATFIAIDGETRRPRQVLSLAAETEEEERVSEQADERRRVRLQRKIEHSRGEEIPLAEVVEERIRGFHQRNLSFADATEDAPTHSTNSADPNSNPNIASIHSTTPATPTKLRDGSLKQSRELLPYKPVSDSHVEMTYVVQPSHANTIGITFGGQIMSWMETAATISAMRHCRCQTALLSVDDLHFNQPTKVGDVVLIASAITRVFHTTMEVRVTVAAENLLTGDRVPCNTGLMVFIALDALKRPAVVAQVMPTTPDEIKQFRQARLRRDRRLDRRAQYFDFDYSSTGSSHAVAYAADAFALARVSQELFAEVEQMRSECAWETVSEEDGIRVAFSPVGYKSDITAVCCHVAVPAKTQSILRLLLDCHSRRSWDVLWVDGRVLEVLDESHDILYEVNAHGPFLSRDFCFLRAWKIDTPLQNNNSSSTTLSSSTTTALPSAVTQDLEHTPCVLAYQSVDHPAAPCRKSYLRGELPPSGWTILPLSPSQSPKPGGPWSEITWMIQCNYKALSLIVGDLVGRGHVIRQIFQGIRRHFAAQNLSS